MWQFWVDRGGTFTDIVARHPDGELSTFKLLSENPEQYVDAAVHGIRQILNLTPEHPFPFDQLDCVKMGTTVATNALLERKGVPTLLLITAGFKDLLRIGYQNRPELFELEIILPELLYSEAREVPERLNADGSVLTPLNLERSRLALQQGYEKGFRSVAIALMHAYLNPQHEITLAEIAKEIGYTQVSTSHETSRLIKLVSRGDTTVVDAYLSPILRQYIEQVANALDFSTDTSGKLYFMQSNGGLTDAAYFQGRNSILSGPAGGVVGMVKTGQSAGFDHQIGFDMGGTSTDVCHFAGELERSFDTEVAGVRMRAPMMNIHTVAAGGGSILSFRDGRYQVGPDSAGANPGPACYRRGGPLTVTDCNVLLGRIHADHFPEVFGPNADQPLDEDIVRQKFSEMAKEIATSTNATPLTPEQTAEGFLRIAVENMANAIKKISVQRGYDVTRYTLNCFGGAGGQHACRVADALGMERVFLHPFAGVLSAYGIGMADIRVLQEAQFQHPLSEAANALNLLNELEATATAEIVSQGIDNSNIQTIRQAHLKYPGSHQTVAVDYSNADQMVRDFEHAHKTQFGFSADERQPVFDMLSVEAIGQTHPHEDRANTTGIATQTSSTNAKANVVMVAAGNACEVPMYQRDNIAAGKTIDGPAIISESTATTVIEPGWQGCVDAVGNLVLSRPEPLARETAIGTSADPIMLEVFNNLFMSIAEQMGSTLANTAYSVNIKERLDFSCALFDSKGNLVANAPHVPVHLGSMSESVRTVARLNQGQMQAGDSYMLNAPYRGGTHLPDVTVITPVFDRKGTEIIFYVGSRGHHADIGGRTPGSAPPDSTHIEEEGVVIDNFKLVERGSLRREATRALLASGRYPCRNIDENMADIEAQIAANTTGIEAVHKMIDQFGLDVVQAYMDHVQHNAEASVRNVIDNLKDGSYSYKMDSGAQINASVTVDKVNRQATIDFTGTSPQQAGNYNAPLAVCHAVVLYVFRTLVGNNIPLNEGCLKPLKIIAPEQSMINPVYPAAVISGNTEVSQSIAECLFAALDVMAGSQGTMNNFVWGNEDFQNYETIAGGTGAGPGFSGKSAVHAHMTNTRMTDPEVLETRFPVMIETFAIRNDSAGLGQWNGGEGIHRRIKFLQPVTVTTLASHRITRPAGRHGAQDGAVGESAIINTHGEKTPLRGDDECELAAGDSFDMLTPGGGGWGKPAT